MREQGGLHRVSVLRIIGDFKNLQAQSLENISCRHVLSSGVPILADEVTEIVQKDVWQIVLASGKIIETATLIYAAGAVPRELGIPGEKRY
ncbi:MAG: hypothetical protein E7244_26895 [Enterocloster citroniae]|nr:hypothetical protein [Enterocloster citroniae]